MIISYDLNPLVHVWAYFLQQESNFKAEILNIYNMISELLGKTKKKETQNHCFHHILSNILMRLIHYI